jgi:histidinol-phosphate aminotransferase
VADHIEALLPYVPGKRVEELERELGITDAVKLASNENPLGPSPHALEAARAAAARAHLYPDDQALALSVALAGVYGVTRAEIGIGHGSNELIDLIVRTFAGPRDHAIVGVPTFACYPLSLMAAHVPTTQVPLREDLFWDLAAVRDALRPETKLVFLDQPGNPTSTHIPADALRAFVRELPPDVILVIDEAYAEFATASDFASALCMRDLRERLIVLRTFSKVYGLAALRVGYAISTPEIIGYLQRMRVPFNASAVAQAAAAAALADVEHLRRSVDHNSQERARVTAELLGLGLQVAPSQTNFLCIALERPASLVYHGLLREGVIVRPFGPPLHRHLRVSLGLTHENDRFLAALARVLEAVPAASSEPTPG